jgi:lipoprotein-anchoring transpeptidase ErfK/SrfK
MSFSSDQLVIGRTMRSQKDSSIDRFKSWKVGALVGLCFGISVSTALTSTPAEAGTITQEMSALQRSSQRWIEINVSTQRLIAWQGHTPIYAVMISTGTDNHPTLTGSYEIQSKYRTARMQGEDYDIPDVPYTMYFYGSYAIHGAYWHHSFGTPVSHGCVNVAVDHAKWLFNWALIGTPVVVHD